MSRNGSPVVHLELHTPNLPRALGFYARLLGWEAEAIHLGPATYQALELGERIEGGVVEREIEQAIWLPYARVDDLCAATDRAREMGAHVALEPREGPAGWRSVVTSPSAAAVALWQPKGRGR
jgi:predicted enzyme related to lactoylglutathione lyase